MNSRLLPGAALLGLVSGVANAAPMLIGTFTETASAACPSPAGSVWPSTPPSRDGDVGGIFNNPGDTSCGPISFTAPFAGTLLMTVQQAVEFASGDVYQAFVNGNSLGLTSIVPVEAPGTSFTSGTFTASIPAGLNSFNINDQILSYLGFQAPYGPANTTVPAGFSPNAVTITLAEELPSPVPEPGSLALLGAWLLGIGLLGRRHRTS